MSFPGLRKKFLLLLLPLWSIAFCQTNTSEGTEFHIAFPQNYNNSTLKIFISSSFNTSGNITSPFPGIDQPFTVTPGAVTEIPIPLGVSLNGGIEDKGIQITSLEPIAVYGLNLRTASTDAYLALPVTALSTNYCVLSMKASFNMPSMVSVVGVYDNTQVTVFDKSTSTTSNVTINKDQTYVVKNSVAYNDMTGSTVTSDKPVAVFGSVAATNIPAACGYADHIIEQMFPVETWGKDFVTVPTAGRDGSGDVFRVLAKEDGTIVTVNGMVAATLNAGGYYESTLTGMNEINASKAVLVAQYAKGQSCSGNIKGDPFMMLIPPREQFLTHYTICTVSPFTQHWVNLIASPNALGTILEDGILLPAGIFSQIGTTSYYGAQRQISNGSHSYSSPSPFGVFVYGWNPADSYGYPGGGSMSPVATVTNLTLTPDTSYGTLNVTSLCYTATVTNSLNQPVNNILVDFFVGGINPVIGNAYTDITGQAQFCYTQTGIIDGEDSVYAVVSGIYSNTSRAFWSAIPCSDPTVPGTIGNTQSNCGDFIPAPLTSIANATGFQGTLEYIWQQSTTDALSGFNDISGTNSPGYAPGLVNQTTWFRRLARVECKPDWTTAAVSNVVEITIIPVVTPLLNIVCTDDSVCTGTTVSFTAFPVNGGIVPFYQWKLNGINTGTNISNYSCIPANGDYVSCTLTPDMPCVSVPSATSNQITITVFPLPVVTYTLCTDSITTTNAKPIKLKGGIPLGGTYSGPGVNSVTGMFSPSIAGIGIKTITYSYTNAGLCSSSANCKLQIVNSSASICGIPFTDVRDGKVYKTVQIASQCWMAEDLNYGTEIPVSKHQRDNCSPEKYTHSSSLIPHSCYQWDELMQYTETPGQQGLCPPEWHIPTEAEWQTLFSNWINAGYAASALKYSGFSGFNAILSGVAHQNIQYDYSNYATFFWTSTPYNSTKAWAHGMNDPDPSVSRYPSGRNNAFGVRCVKD